MMTIDQYRSAESVTLPRNSSGFEMPQLIDDIWEAREHIIEIRTHSQYTIYQSAHLVEAIARLNRALSLLEIDLHRQI